MKVFVQASAAFGVIIAIFCGLCSLTGIPAAIRSANANEPDAIQVVANWLAISAALWIGSLYVLLVVDRREG